MNSSMRGGVVLHGLLLLYNHFTTFDLFSLLQTAERRTFHKLIMAQVSSLRELAFASLASLLQRSMTNVAADQKLILDFTNYEIVDDKMDDFETFIQSEEARTIMKYYKPIRRILVTSDLKKIYETLFKSSWSHGLKNSWLWFFYQNMESDCLVFTFNRDTEKMDMLKYHYIAKKENPLLYCKILRLHALPLPDNEFKEHQIKMLNFLDKFPSLEEFIVTHVTYHDKELKFRVMMAVSNFTELKTLRLPPLFEDDFENFKRFIEWAPKTIQTLCLEFKPQDIFQVEKVSINFLDGIFKSLTAFTKLVSLKLIMNYKPAIPVLPIHLKASFGRRRVQLTRVNPFDPRFIRRVLKKELSMIGVVDALEDNEEKIDCVTSISINSGHMFVLRLIDKNFKDVKHLELVKFFNGPFLMEGVPVTKNLQSVQHLNVNGINCITFTRRGHEFKFPQNQLKLSAILSLFPNVQNLTSSNVQLQADEIHDDIPETTSLKKLVSTSGMIRPPNIVSKLPNLTCLVLSGIENDKYEANKRELEEYLPPNCQIIKSENIA